MKVLRIVVVEDEALQREQILGWLAAEQDVTVVGTANDGRSAVRVIDELCPDVVLLDVSLPECSGLDVLEQITVDPRVVFTTAHREHAVAAFELGAIDYLLKPFSRERLMSALRRVQERPAEEGARIAERVAAVRDEGVPVARLFVRDHTGILPLPVEVIVRLESDGDYAAVIAGRRRYLVGMSLTALHDRIGRPDFVRVHRQHVVNLAHVVRFTPHDAVRLRVELADGSSVVASRAGSQLLRQLVG